MYNIFIESGIPIKLARVIKMCLNMAKSGLKKNSEVFPTKNGLKQVDALLPLLSNFTLEYAIRRVQVNWSGLKLNGTHQILVYEDDGNILGGSVHTTNKKHRRFSIC